MKYQVDEKVRWQNDKLMNWPFDEMASWEKWRVKGRTSWQNGEELLKCH